MSQEFFRISSGLKNLIGSELITDNFVAVFELVKNSFDANATEVKISFENIYSHDARIVIQDNGKGMDYNDLMNKWLFVAYSAKRDGTEDEDYRNRIKSQRYYAGAKGVGRFSCDRLGRYLRLVSIKDIPNAKIESLSVDWERFEEDQQEEFITIPVDHEVLAKNPYTFTHGTALEITGIDPDDWNRENLKRLKDKLSKLIRPDLNTTASDEHFRIILSVPEELENDKIAVKKGREKSENEGYFYYNTVNGEVKNFIFDELDIRTTKIQSEITEDGEYIETSLIDRDVFIYRIRERNRFNLLSNVSITIYFLNRSAKHVFTQRMGIRNVDYGSLFVYKNGFRIYPYGERGDDSLGVDNRAVQGFNRFIGLRNLIGQIDIQGDNTELREATSRDAGLVKSKTFHQLAGFAPRGDSLLVSTLRKLERYVVEVTEWGINDESYKIGESESGKRELVKLISNIYDDKTLLKVEYNKDIVDIIDQKEEKSAKRLLSNFKRLAAESDDEQLLKDAKKLEKKITQQSLALDSANKEIQEKEKLGESLKKELEQQISETLFAKADRTTGIDDLLSVQHHIYRHSAQHITAYVDALVDAISSDSTKDELLKLVSKISLENRKVITLSRFVTKAQFDTTVSKINADLIDFVNEYVVNVYQEYKHLTMNNQKLKISATKPEGVLYELSFRPIEIIIVLDNLLNNSFKANASEVRIFWKSIEISEIELHIADNGVGIPSENQSRIFDPRFTTTKGSGLGLYHTKEVIEKMGGTISVANSDKKGAEFIITFRK